MEELKNRIIKRGSETPESLIRRFESAFEEINYISRYNYAVINNTVEEALSKASQENLVTRAIDSGMSATEAFERYGVL